ncbi:MAG: DUF5683 domain-containing protein [Prevotellaceae bacterium]|jgi:hypothetical protein|nr:DUF5683 domain-containing protein [Prevotellaceae bacterium]
MKLRLSIVTLVLLFCAKNLSAQSDSIQRITENDTLFLTAAGNKTETLKVNDNTAAWKPNPKKAVLWALIPGGGQIYNRKYWKLPIVYGAGLGLTYGFTWNNQYYEDYKNAYIDLFHEMREEPNGKRYENMLPRGTDMANVDKTWLFSVLERKKDFYRRNRDLCIIGAVGVYGLTILDAFVDAQLFEFDISPDLTMNVYPVLDPTPYSAAVGVQMQFKF